MKRFLSLTLLLCIVLTGCNAGGAPPVSSGSQGSQGASEASDASPPPNDADVIIAGGGGAGLCAALAAAQRGKSVILLEKTTSLGGAAIASAGILPAVGTRQQTELGIEDTVEAMARDILRPSHYSVRRELVYAASENAASTIEWLEQFGVEFSLVTNDLYYGQTQYRMHAAKDGGRGLVMPLIDAVNRHERISIMLNTPATGLLYENDEVAGVTANHPERGEIQLRAENTVLATSGFAANIEMLRQYIPEMANAYQNVAKGATGEGIRWGMELGAAVNNMHAYQGYGLYGVDYHGSIDLFLLYRGGILVNQDGERFTNEHMGYSELAPHVLAQPGFYAYLIFDEANAKATAAMSDYLEQDIVDKADSIEELASLLEIEPAKLRRTMDEYTAAFAEGEDRFNRTLLPDSFTTPYYSIKVTADIRHTQGGLVTDIAGHVLRADKSVIKGLYACGGVSEGFSSAGGPGYMSGNGLLQAMVLGKLAGEQAASESRASAQMMEYKAK